MLLRLVIASWTIVPYNIRMIQAIAAKPAERNTFLLRVLAAPKVATKDTTCLTPDDGDDSIAFSMKPKALSAAGDLGKVFWRVDIARSEILADVAMNDADAGAPRRAFLAALFKAYEFGLV